MKWTPSNSFPVGKYCWGYFVSWLHLLSFGTWMSLVAVLSTFAGDVCQPMDMSLVKRPLTEGLYLGTEFSLCMSIVEKVCQRPYHLLSHVLPFALQHFQPHLCWALRHEFPTSTKGRFSVDQSWSMLSIFFVLKISNLEENTNTTIIIIIIIPLTFMY